MKVNGIYEYARKYNALINYNNKIFLSFNQYKAKEGMSSLCRSAVRNVTSIIMEAKGQEIQKLEVLNIFFFDFCIYLFIFLFC